MGDEETCPLRIKVKTLPRADPLTWFNDRELCRDLRNVYLYSSMVESAIGLTEGRSLRNAKIELGSWYISIQGTVRLLTGSSTMLIRVLDEARLFVSTPLDVGEVIVVRAVEGRIIGTPLAGVVSLNLRSETKRVQFLALAFSRPCIVEHLTRHLCTMRLTPRTAMIVSTTHPYNILLRALYQALHPCTLPIKIRDPCTMVLSCKAQNENLFNIELWNLCFEPINAFICLNRGRIQYLEIGEARFSVSTRCVRIPLDPHNPLRVAIHVG